MPAPHPHEFKHRALEFRQGDKPDAQIARELGIAESGLRRWMAQDKMGTGQRGGLTTDGRKELVELGCERRLLEMENEIPKRVAADFAGENALSELLLAGPYTHDGFPVAVACRVLKVSTSGPYDWHGRPPSARAVADAQLPETGRTIHADPLVPTDPRGFTLIRGSGLHI